MFILIYVEPFFKGSICKKIMHNIYIAMSDLDPTDVQTQKL